MLHRVTSRVAKELAPGIEALFFPRCVNILKEGFAQPKVDLDHLWPITTSPGISIGHTHALHSYIDRPSHATSVLNASARFPVTVGRYSVRATR